MSQHLRQLSEVRDQAGDPLAAVLEAYAFIQHGHSGGHMEAMVHHGDHVGHARRELHGLIRDLLAEQASDGRVRTDVPADELAAFCLQALTAAVGLPSKAAVRRLVGVVRDALRPPG
ncbi:hypothetical protein [Actinophytocola sp.]|uniref:hypothetical protein n=1 Tax=Actinophytocola sp. TaxID=1872138 RepID=UPI0025B7C176|nr:hypothetical protein [Actinophytocola sp.]